MAIIPKKAKIDRSRRILFTLEKLLDRKRFARGAVLFVVPSSGGKNGDEELQLKPVLPTDLRSVC